MATTWVPGRPWQYLYWARSSPLKITPRPSDAKGLVARLEHRLGERKGECKPNGGFPTPYTRGMRRVGRPPIGDRVTVRLPADLLNELDRRARGAGLSRAEAIRLLLDRALSPTTDDGVDRTQIAHRLAMTPAERVHRMAEETRRLQVLHGRAL